MEHGLSSASRDGVVVIGWREYAGLPDWDIRRIKLKADTGARTSVLDVASYELREVEDQGLIATLRLALDRRRPERFKVIHTPVLQMVVVRNSSGLREERPLVETRLQLGPIVKPIRLTITDRSGMRFRMLLGRKALERDFLVDVSRQYLLRAEKSSHS